MAQSGNPGLESFTVDTANLYREESITDLQAATIRRLVPITVAGDVDAARAERYIGDTTLMTQMGPIPVQFALDANSLAEACAVPGWRARSHRAPERSARELAREEASRIVVPGQGGGRACPAPCRARRQVPSRLSSVRSPAHTQQGGRPTPPPGRPHVRHPVPSRSRDVAVERGQRRLVEGLAFTAAGTLLQLAGPNGCGKTSVLRALAGLAAPVAGSIDWCGRRLAPAGAASVRS